MTTKTQVLDVLLKYGRSGAFYWIVRFAASGEWGYKTQAPAPTDTDTFTSIERYRRTATDMRLIETLKHLPDEQRLRNSYEF